MRAPVLVVCVLFAGCSMTDRLQNNPEPGIDRELARVRAARFTDVHYALHFDLLKGMDQVAGTSRMEFKAADTDAPLVLDFAGEALSLKVNGAPLEPAPMVANHVVIPTALLRVGDNVLEASFRSPVAPTGTPLTSYRDPSDDADYLYTLVVPADAHVLFPCLDQPDIKARFTLSLTTPRDWIAVANGEESRVEEGGRSRWSFKTTPALPTYLFAFAAGPFEVVTDPKGSDWARGLRDPMRIYVRPSKRADTNAEDLFRMHGESLAWQEDYFDYEYPFHKLDIVLCPGFPYGGMEHAGAIFYRESALAFDHEPTELERLRRSTLIYHEVSHQWFGNLVTMEWFDDLWLKEGFATFVGYRTLDALEPEMNAWTRFHQRVKPTAVRIDQTEGTTPIFQELGNLADAKSAYGPIVYNKAPAVLRQLEHHLGASGFRDGVRQFLKRHEFANATWRDLLRSLGDAVSEDLGPWSERWILDRGMPRVRASLKEGEGLAISQSDTLEKGRVWPIKLQVLMGRGGRRESVAISLDSERTSIDTDSRTPDWVLPNADGVAFTQVVLDAKSLDHWLRHLPTEEDPLVRAMAFTAIWDSVREGICEPSRFARLALDLVERERDPQTWSSALGALTTTLVRYMRPADAKDLMRRTTGILGRLLSDPTAAPIRLQALRAMARLAADEDALRRIERILDAEETIPGIKLGVQDRFRLLTPLLATHRPRATDRLRSMEASDADVARWAFQARAAVPTEVNKKIYFESFLTPDGPPEQWVSGALGAFHWPGQSHLTLPFLEPALDAAPWVKENRKIFFMPAWLESFLGAHADPEALAVVETWLRRQRDLPKDIRRKLLVPLHELRRAVRIRVSGDDGQQP